MHCSKPHEEWNRSKRDADSNEHSDAGNEVRDADEKQPGDEWNERALPATVDAVPGAKRAEEQTEEEERGAHGFRRVV